MSIRVLLVCSEGIAQRKYLDASKELGAQIDIASSLKEFYEAIIETPYNGLMIDVPTKLKVFGNEKEKVNNILEQYPVTSLVIDSKSGQINSFCSGQAKASGTLEDFITQQCGSFNARTLRSDRRRNNIFNVILSKSNNVSHEDHEKTVIMNVSRTGCFIFSTGNWEVNSDAWFIIKELTDQTPIRGQVRWKVDWNKGMSVPGIGVKFEDIKDCQFKEICDKSKI